jgi:hypothetical protein
MKKYGLDKDSIIKASKKVLDRKKLMLWD